MGKLGSFQVNQTGEVSFLFQASGFLQLVSQEMLIVRFNRILSPPLFQDKAAIQYPSSFV